MTSQPIEPNRTLIIVPIHFREACQFITQYHRHHAAPPGYKFAVAVQANNTIVGVAMTGRPVSRYLDDHFTLEVTRCCTNGIPNGCSLLYGACRRAAKALGYRQIITYILATEPGTSLRAAGWTCLGPTGGVNWNCRGLPRKDSTSPGIKVKYISTLC